jgi:hypothetical protein
LTSHEMQHSTATTTTSARSAHTTSCSNQVDDIVSRKTTAVLRAIARCRI